MGKKNRPLLTEEAQENRNCGLAAELAEKQLREGTASSQVVSHYLKLSATKEERQLKKEILEKEKELLTAKIESIKSSQKMEELFNDAMNSMIKYGGRDGNDEESEDIYGID